MDLSQSDWEYLEERADSFVGREWVFARVRSFLAGPPGTFLLRGDPGTGKTAVAARLAQASCGRTKADSLPAQPPPVAEGAISAAVVCRAGRTAFPELFQRLSRQLAESVHGFAGALQSTLPEINLKIENVHVETGDVRAGANVTGVRINIPIEINGLSDERAFDALLAVPLRQVRERGPAQPIVLLVDALDEAAAAAEVNTFSRRLAKLDGVHLIVTCRPVGSVLTDFRGAEQKLDLTRDAPSDDHDVREYVRNRLRGRGPEGVIAAVGDRVADEAAGNFLYAFYVIGALIQSGSLTGTDEKAARSLPLPAGGLPGVYEDFLDRQIAGNETRWAEEVRPVLAPLCVALGDGFTTEQIGAIAGRLTGRDFPKSTARDVTRTAGQFLDGPPPDGPFRVYHQSFARFLTDPEQNPNWPIDPAETNDAVVQALSDTVPESQPGAKEWTAASAYVRHHLAAHAASAAKLDALIADPDFVLACDLGRLLAVLDQARTEDGRTTADIIVRAAAHLEPRKPDSASYLQMFARQLGATAFADRVGRIPGHPLPWSTRWAHVMPRTPHQVLGRHDGAATTITSLVLPDGRQVAVSGGADGVVRVWNLEPGIPIHEPRDIGTPVRSIRPLKRRDGQSGVLLLDQAGTCTWWDLTGSPASPLNLDGQAHCQCVAILERDDRATALLGCGSTIVEYDIERQCAVRTIDLASCDPGRPVQVSGIAVLPGPEGDRLLVADLSGRGIAVADLASGDAAGTLTAPSDGERATGPLLAVAHVSGRRVAVLQGRRDIQFWDLDLRTRIGYATMGGAYGYGTLADGRPVVLATDLDDMFGAWDLSDLMASCSPEAAGELTDQIRKAVPVLPVPEEGSETLSTEQLAELINDAPASVGLSGPVRAIASIAQADGRSATVAYAGPGDQRLWPAEPAPPDPGPEVFATNRGPLPGLAATVHDAINQDNNRIDTWILPPPPGRGQRLLGHVGGVTAATLTAPVAGDDFALSAGDDGTIRSWRLQLSQVVPHGLRERNQRTSALATADVGDLGQVIITGGVDGQMRIWSPRDGSTLGKPLSGNGYAIRSMVTTYTTTGTYVGALHQNRKLRIWNLATGRMFTEITPAEAFTFTVVDDGRPGVAVRTAFHALEVYNLASSQWSGKPTPLHGPSHGGGPIISVQNPDGYKIILTEDGQLKMLDVQSGESGERASIALGEASEATDLVFLMSRNGIPCLIAITSSGTSARELRGKPPLAQRTLPADITQESSLSSVLATGRLPDGTAVVVLGQPKGHEFCFLDPDDLTPFGLIATDSVIDALDISDEGTVIVATEIGLLAITPSTARTPLPPRNRAPAGTSGDHGRAPSLGQSCDLAGIAAAAADSLAGAFNAAGISIQRKLGEVQAMGDPRQLHERISYLLMSMAKFTAAGGSLLLETGPNEQQAAVQISKIGAVIPDDELVDFLVMITTGPQSGGELNADNAQVTVTLPLA